MLMRYKQLRAPAAMDTSSLFTHVVRRSCVRGVGPRLYKTKNNVNTSSLSRAVPRVAEATVLGVIEDDKQGYAVVLDRTIFHPQGGGQPSDTGAVHKVSDYHTAHCF